MISSVMEKRAFENRGKQKKKVVHNNLDDKEKGQARTEGQVKQTSLLLDFMACFYTRM